MNELLKKIPIFKKLKEETLLKLEKISKIKELNKGDILF